VLQLYAPPLDAEESLLLGYKWRCKHIYHFEQGRFVNSLIYWQQQLTLFLKLKPACAVGGTIRRNTEENLRDIQKDGNILSRYF
jgi:hypothetical protein